MRKINIDDLALFNGATVEESAREYCKECEFEFVAVEEYGERYFVDGTEMATVIITVED